MTTATAARRRTGGILLHPTSLSGPFGIGDLGPDATQWVDVLAAAGQSWWQVLPLGPTGFGNSPYQSFSAFAGNPLLVSPELLARAGLLNAAELTAAEAPAGRVDFDRVAVVKGELIARAWERLAGSGAAPLRSALEQFEHEQAFWLDDYSLFMALKGAHGGVAWWQWPADYRRRRPDGLNTARRELAEAIAAQRFAQFLFFHQWDALHRHAAERGVRLVGDLPIYVAEDSADVWSHGDLFLLDADGRPTHVAGVPPDYFSLTGQRWGNPLYAWPEHARTGYAWWIARLKQTLATVDLIRLDHFRGLEAYWEIPAELPTAEIGRWAPGPGADLLEALRSALGGLPLIAEDLGVITSEVEALRRRFDLPGMRILQFAFGGAVEERFLPHGHDYNSVVYTGTHDNDTLAGWLSTLTAEEEAFFHRYVPPTADGAVWDLIRTAWSSPADHAVVPFQDLLALGTEARMNHPGIGENNWDWRMTDAQLQAAPWQRLREMTETYRRLGTTIASTR